MVLRIGLAMLQGARYEHAQALLDAGRQLGIDVEIAELRSATDVSADKLDALVLPGGESTTMRIAAEEHGLLEALFDWIRTRPDRPVLGTCAGAILLCNPAGGRAPYIDSEIDRNAYGAQRDSFQADLSLSNLVFPEVTQSGDSKHLKSKGNHSPLPVRGGNQTESEGTFPGVFIRAPRLTSIGAGAETVARLGDEVVGIRQANRVALTFHPELTSDNRFHRWLVATAAQS